MENRERVFFADDRAQWYLAGGGSHLGPLTAADVYEKITAREITWAHYLWRRGEKQWARVCDILTFQVALPQKPEQGTPTLPAEKAASRSSSGAESRKGRLGADAGLTPLPEERMWFLFYNQSQYGPFSKDEVNRLILVGRIHGRVHAWKNGRATWERLERIGDFREVLANAADLPEVQTLGKTASRATAAAKRSTRAKGAASSDHGSVQDEPSVRLNKDKRRAMRAPLVAKIVMADEKGVSVGVCRDISIGGMQVLTDRIPGDPGNRIRLNVSALGEKGGTSDGEAEDDHGRRKIESFVAEGVIVRILEDNRGFSFRFDKLSAAAKRSIERYIESTA